MWADLRNPEDISITAHPKSGRTVGLGAVENHFAIKHTGSNRTQQNKPKSDSGEAAKTQVGRSGAHLRQEQMYHLLLWMYDVRG